VYRLYEQSCHWNTRALDNDEGDADHHLNNETKPETTHHMHMPKGSLAAYRTP